MWMLWRTDALKKAWLLTGVFLIGYGSVRFVVELFRQPDAQFQSPTNPVGYILQFGEAGLSMGQVLTLPMIAIGILLAIGLLRT